jgi:hypothetical protein
MKRVNDELYTVVPTLTPAYNKCEVRSYEERHVSFTSFTFQFFGALMHQIVYLANYTVNKEVEGLKPYSIIIQISNIFLAVSISFIYFIIDMV